MPAQTHPGRRLLFALTAGAMAATCTLAQVQDWSNLGGNGRMNGLVNVVGPDGVGASDLLWEGGPFSYIAWNPVIEGRRVFMVRQTDFPQNNPPPNDATIYAMDLDTGATLWTADLPFEDGDWTTWIAGVKNGRLFASRSGNGASVSSPLYCLDAATGAVLWNTSGNSTPPRYEINSGPYTGAVFADDGDIIFASWRWVERFDAETGGLVWRTPRVEQLGNSTGAVIAGNAVYVPDLIAGTNQIAIRKFDATTGAFLYRGPLCAGGGLLHNGAFLGTDGRIYLNTSQNFNIAFDFLYSFTDTGTAIVQNWRTSSGGGGEFSRWGVGPDGSVYSMSWTGTPDFEASGTLERLDPATGNVIATYPTPISGDYTQVHVAIDSRGVIYLSNGTAGGANGGRLYSFNPDLTLRWETPIDGNLNQGGPVLGTDGTLVIASTDTLVRAYRTAQSCPADFNADGFVDFFDFDDFVACFEGDPCPPGKSADFNNDGFADFFDFDDFVAAFEAGC
jgi:outer membrane protein assembly factor BamB